MTDSSTSLSELLGHQFKDEGLRTLAFTHPSANKTKNNQRLEFLGDAVLGLIVAEMVYHAFPSENEGELARRQAALVCAPKLVEIASALDLGEHLHVSASEAASGGRSTNSNLEDALEAAIGALYLDGGLAAAKQFVEKHWTPHVHSNASPPKDSKTALQEWAQGRGLPLPVYTVSESKGPAHAPTFTVEVAVKGHAPASATANSKRAAEQAAAKILLGTLA